MNPGEIVCDSILENKEMTKSYWEERMMAAASEENKTHKDSSPAVQYFVSQTVSLVETAPDSLEPCEGATDTSPKIVETVAKSRNEDSALESEIQLQDAMEGEGREVESAINDKCSTPAPPFSQMNNSANQDSTITENRIALELREMREREEELRQLRHRFSTAATGGDLPSDTFQSIPTTDEGNFSEYGSEEKELSLDGGNSSRVMSPEVPLSQNSFSHQRSQSMDSMSSGHSSGSGGEQVPHRRRITVKPLEEPQDEEIPAYLRNRMTETPIEREIRLSAEREEELRREKGVPIAVSPVSPSATKWSVPRAGGIANDSRDVQHRLATSRIQQEIQEATQREKELVAAGQIQTISEDTVDSKVTRFTELAEYAIAEREKKKQKSEMIPTKDTPIEKEQEVDTITPSVVVNDSPRVVPLVRAQSTPVISPATPSIGSPVSSIANNRSMTNGTPRFRKFEPMPGQRGLMQRFLASKGRMVGMSPFTASPGTSTSLRSPQIPSPVASPNPVSPLLVSQSPPIFPVKQVERVLTHDSQKSLDSVDGRPETKAIAQRRGYMSAEEKIQEELMEMKKREDELRLQRAHLFARSQPNLLSLVDEEEDASLQNKEDRSVSSMRTALSNPNLLDSDDSSSMTDSSSYDKTSQKATRKRSALIAQWENMIQQYSEH